jgi:hypothetical protein
MSDIASARINSFGSTVPIATHVPPEDFVIEIPISELQHLFNVQIETYNNLNELLKDQGILRGRELAEMNARVRQAVNAEKNPLGKLHLINAYIRQQIGHVKKALQARPPTAPTNEGQIRQAITKIQLRAISIIEYIKTLAEGKDKIALNSSQARQFLAGREGKSPSRRDAIRALKRAEMLCPALSCTHTPNDGRQTIRLTAKGEALKDFEIIKINDERSRWQRLRMEELHMIFFKNGGSYA